MAKPTKPLLDDDEPVLPPADLAAGDPPAEIPGENPPVDPPAEVVVEAPKKAYAADDFTAHFGSDKVVFKKGDPIVDSGQLWQLKQYGHPIEFR